MTWYAIVAPPNTPSAIVDKINAGVNEALRDPDVQKRLADLTAEPVGGTPQATAAYYARGSRALEERHQRPRT